jgi:hypothetical protein
LTLVKNSSWQAKQQISASYYRNVLLRLRENVPKLHSEIWRQKNWLLHHGNAPSHISFFIREFFYQKQHDCRPHPTYFPLFSRLKTKLKSRHFDTTEVIEAEPQAVLNTLTEHGFQDTLKTADELGTVHTQGTTSSVMVASRTKVRF